MKQYTLYQAIKYSDGKLTRNKLEKEIKKGSIVAQKGTGKAKYLIDEDELLKYLQRYGDDLNKKLVVPKENLNETKTIVNDKYIEQLLEAKENLIKIKDEEISSMKEQHQKYLPKIEEEENKESERKKLILELSGISIFRKKRKTEILSRLMELS